MRQFLLVREIVSRWLDKVLQFLELSNCAHVRIFEGQSFTGRGACTQAAMPCNKAARYGPPVTQKQALYGVHRDFELCVGDMEECYGDDIGDPERLAFVIRKPPATNSKT